MLHRSRPPKFTVPLETQGAKVGHIVGTLIWKQTEGFFCRATDGMSAEPGKFADLIAVDGDPLVDIRVLQNVKFVMKGGALIKDVMP